MVGRLEECPQRLLKLLVATESLRDLIVNEDGSLEQRRVAYDHVASATEMIERFGDVAWVKRSVDRLLYARA